MSDESRRAPDRWMRLPSTGMLITFLCLGCNKPRARGDAGIERAAAATERRNPGWIEKAIEAVRQFAAKQTGGVFTAEMFRAMVQKDLPPPSDERSWGSVTREARRRKYIEQVPGQYFPAASSNGSPKPVYRTGPQAHVKQEAS